MISATEGNGAPAYHHDAVGEIDSLVDPVRDHEDGLGIGLAAPELDELLL